MSFSLMTVTVCGVSISAAVAFGEADSLVL